jgi:hypothetical protein
MCLGWYQVEWLIVKDLEGGGCGLIYVIFPQLPRETEEIGTVGASAEIQT